MPRLPHRRLDERPAHIEVTAERADALYTSNAVDWPVSGDETLREVGRTIVRRGHRVARLWQMPGVVPKVPTTGIRVGDTITAYEEWEGEEVTGVVTHVGTVAGWLTPDGGHTEVRWSVETVTGIIPAV